jgi:hypothetical protein
MTTEKIGTYAIPNVLVALVHDFDSSRALAEVLSNAVLDGLDKIEDRLLRQSSVAVFNELDDQVSAFANQSDMVDIELSLPRTVYIKLRLTAKEYTKSPTELLCCCLAQSYSGTVNQ